MNNGRTPAPSASLLRADLLSSRGIAPDKIRGEHIEDFISDLKRIFPPLDPGAIENLLPGATAQPRDSAPFWGVIVETRPHPALHAVVRNVACGLNIPVQLFHGDENLEYITGGDIGTLITEGRVHLTAMRSVGRFGQDRYNRLLLSQDFWELLKGRNKILMFQTDSLYCPQTTYRLEDFADYDYVGGNWPRQRPVGLVLDGGSGGFSLRDWALSRSCLERFPSSQWAGGEDGYFAFHLSLMGGRVAPISIADRFATQDFFRARSLGCHQINRLPAGQKDAFLRYCPEAAIIA